MHLEQQIKEFADTFPKNKQTHRMIEEPTCDPSASYSPSVALVVASNPSQITKIFPARMKNKQQRDSNIQMPIQVIQLN